jgi:hypothetical protein
LTEKDSIFGEITFKEFIDKMRKYDKARADEAEQNVVFMLGLMGCSECDLKQMLMYNVIDSLCQNNPILAEEIYILYTKIREIDE